MTDDEFIVFFHKVLDGMPNYARNSIRNYWVDNGISYEVVLSDNAVDIKERAHNREYPTAIMSVWEPERKWQFAFREFLTLAPSKVLATVIQHELIHGFLCPFLHPLPHQKPLSKLAASKFSEFEALAIAIPDDPNEPVVYEEKLVLIIQVLFHGDEQTANAWTRLNSPMRQKHS